jgi:hypothetical protein
MAVIIIAVAAAIPATCGLGGVTDLTSDGNRWDPFGRACRGLAQRGDHHQLGEISP